MNKKVSVITLSIVLILSAFTGNVFAATVPSFPVCVNPQGTVISSHDSGTHGVAGDTGVYTGKDTVYSLTSESLTQCLCADSGAGTQTNWWKASSLTQDEINIYISEGWILIPNGAAWGLEQAPYLAKNSSYACKGGSGGSSETKVGGASAVNNTQSILSLATTGNTMFILGVFLTGMSFIGAGLASTFKKRS